MPASRFGVGLTVEDDQPLGLGGTSVADTPDAKFAWDSAAALLELRDSADTVRFSWDVSNGNGIVTGNWDVDGVVTAGDGTGTAQMFIDGAAGSQRQLQFQTNASLRWLLAADNVAESGSDAGSDLILRARTDAGAAIDEPLKIIRAANGLFKVVRPVEIQVNSGAAVPALVLDQDDVDEPFINFEGTTGADTTSSISTHTTSGATTHHIQFEINGTKAWIAASTNNPSA